MSDTTRAAAAQTADHHDPDLVLLVGDARTRLRELPAGSVQAVVTSPPYFGQRQYLRPGSAVLRRDLDAAGRIAARARLEASGVHPAAQGPDPMWDLAAVPAVLRGLLEPAPEAGAERTLEGFVDSLVAVMREVRRVLRDDGTVWLNLGDTYAADRGGTPMPAETIAGGQGGRSESASARRGRAADGYIPHRDAPAIGLKHKDLALVPPRVALALQADGWVVRNAAVWAKPNPVPERAENRLAKSHELVYLLSKGRWTGPVEPAPLAERQAMRLAALVDAAGSVALGADGRPRVTLRHRDAALLEGARSLLGAGELRRFGVHWRWRLEGDDATALLYRIRRHLEGSRAAADLALSGAEGAARGGSRRATGERAAYGRWARAALAAIRRGGAPDLTPAQRPRAKWTDQPYYWDHEASREPAADGAATRNRRDVMTVPVRPFRGAHSATFPEELVEPMIAMSTRAGDLVLDPFAGSGTTAAVAIRLGRRAALVELNPAYAALVLKRLARGPAAGDGSGAAMTAA